ncbi:MAG: WbqC family protein [bacterium]|nr:WbqC family protein [bacterium]
MILSGHQPEYLPYLGFIHKIAKAGQFILVDHVQYLEKSFQNSNRIRTAPGQEGFTWLIVPVKSHGRRYQKINEVEIDNSVAWGKKHWKTIYLNYKKAPFFDNYQEFFEKLYLKKWDKLVDLNETIIYYLVEKLGVKTPIVRSSDYDFKEKKNDLLIEMCKKLKAGAYLSGQGAKCYVDEEKFKKNGLNHIFSDFKHPTYLQRFKPFAANLSVIDLLFNCGPESLNIILNNKH